MTATGARRRRLSVAAAAVVGMAALAAVIGLAVTRHDSTAGYDTNPKAFVLPHLGSRPPLRRCFSAAKPSRAADSRSSRAAS